MPWEIEGWNFIFGGVDDNVEIGNFSEVVIYDALSLHVKGPAGEPSQSDFARKRLTIARLVEDPDHLRWLALLKFRNMVPTQTVLGQCCLVSLGVDACSGKSTATPSEAPPLHSGGTLNGSWSTTLATHWNPSYTATCSIWRSWQIPFCRLFVSAYTCWEWKV